SSEEPADLGGPAMQIAAGGSHACAVMMTGEVRCWGEGTHGRLGYGNTDHIGDDEPPSVAGIVDIDGLAKQVVSIGYHTCALLTNDSVRCWGYNLAGDLGYGISTSYIGDDELPTSLGYVPIGGPVARIVPSSSFGGPTCAQLATGGLRCWGGGFFGSLGYGTVDDVGDNETPADVPDVSYLDDIPFGGLFGLLTALQ
ncbi:MAG: hypothetical protein AAGC55_05390, partial [Myxococcota bacterium]